MYLGTSPAPARLLRQLRHSDYAAAFLATGRFAEFWLHDLRHHACLALIMARAGAQGGTPGVAPAALTRRSLCDLSTMSMSGVHALLAEACERGDFRRDADAGDRRRVMLLPTEATALAFGILLRKFLEAARGEALSPALLETALHEPQILALYARFACALVGARRPGGRLWVEPGAIALLTDVMAGPPSGPRRAQLVRGASLRGQRGTLEGDLAFAAMAGLVDSIPGGRVWLTQEGRACMATQLEMWRSGTTEVRLALAQLSAPMSSVAA